MCRLGCGQHLGCGGAHPHLLPHYQVCNLERRSEQKSPAPLIHGPKSRTPSDEVLRGLAETKQGEDFMN